jgi:glucan phosphoethanolaminetransferase (alkaline phosphatase superfamily)
MATSAPTPPASRPRNTADGADALDDSTCSHATGDATGDEPKDATGSSDPNESGPRESSAKVSDEPEGSDEPSRADAERRAAEARKTLLGVKRAVVVRRWLSRALFVVPTLLIVAVDVARREERLTHFTSREKVFYLVSVLASLWLWGGLLAAASRHKGFSRWPARVIVLVAGVLAFGAQLYTFDRYMAYMNHRAVLVGTQMMPSIGQQLWYDRVTFAKALLPPILLALFIPLAARKLAPTPKGVGRASVDFACVALLIVMFVDPERGGEQGATPDTLYVSAMGQLARARWDHNETVDRVHPGPRTPLSVPEMHATPAVKRNVLFIVTESVRSHSTCVEYTEDCKFTPFSNKAVPDRIPFPQMRALDSTTAISLAIMWTGLNPTESRKDLHSAPLLWEYLHAAHLAGTYFTSQNLLFGNSGTWLEGVPITRRVSATEIEPDASYETGADDGLLVDYVNQHLDGLPEPRIDVVHLSNTHFPYKVDPKFSPFLPQEEATGPGYENEILNRYQDAIYLQDIAVGRFLTEFKKRPEAARTVIVFVSDHGEQMREKGGVGHTGTVYDAEIRIPFWIDAPPGTLTDAERKNLMALRNRPLLSIDILPTMLDFVGLWDAPELQPFRARMPGGSLLRGGSPLETPIALTNCTELWACAFKNWGAINGTRKLIANQADHSWLCFDVATDPQEKKDLGVEACKDLLPLAEGNGKGRPF